MNNEFKNYFYIRLMEDIFSYQKIYLLTNNYNIIDFKKISEVNKTYDNLHELKKVFYKKVISNIKDKNCILSIKEFILKYKIYMYDDIYDYISKFNSKYINEQIIEYNFIREIYNLNCIDTLILKNIYDNKIIIKNEKYLTYLFNTCHIYLDKIKYIDIYHFYHENNINDRLLIKNIQEIESKFNYIKKTKVFGFYKKLLTYKKYNDDDLICYLLLNDYELCIDKFAKIYDDVQMKHKIYKNLNIFYAFYFTNFGKFNFIVSEKLFLKLYQNFDIIFFKNIYNNLLIQNNIDLSNNLDIYNFYFKNNELLINIDEFNNKFKHINQHFIQNIYLNNDCDNLYTYVNYIINNSNILLNIQDFISNYSDFNMSIYLKNTKNSYIKNNFDIIKELIENKPIIKYKIKKYTDIDTDFINKYYNYKNINKYDIELLLSINNNFIYNLEEYERKNNINIIFIKIFNNLLLNKTYKYIINKLIDNDIDNIDNDIDNIDNDIDNIILDYTMFKRKYIGIINNSINKNEEYLNAVDNINSNDELITFFTKDVYKLNSNRNCIGRKNVYMIEEVLVDLKCDRPKLMDGISLIIRAKNEEKNITLCIESVIDLVDEIIFVNNGSTDNTLKIIEELAMKYSKIKVYNYYINVNRVGIEHNKALKNDDNNTLGNFYNWCLYKSTMKHIIKWDADFICIRNNFKSMIDKLRIKDKNNKYAVWFTGYTLFVNNNKNYINLDSYYNEFRLFSYVNNFKWDDGDVCEYTDPYINSCQEKIYVNEPIFYEIKRADLDEFSSRSSLIDTRDIKDFDILSKLSNTGKNENTYINNLYSIDEKMINYKLNILIIVNNFNIGGSNIFILELYKYFKLFGFNVRIYGETITKTTNKFNIINKNDIFNVYDDNKNLEEDIQKYDYIFLNGFIPSNIITTLFTYDIKKVFITHSDVAYSNSYIEKYNDDFYKIVCVNNYTKTKLERILNIKSEKVNKIINYMDLKHNKDINLKINKKFGIITRFSEDKNIIMLLFSLQKFFKIYNDYEFYLVGYESDYMQSYILYLITYLKLDKFIKVEGYQDNTKKYYDMFDFIILPSVSEGTPYNLIESMIYKKLIISSDVGGNCELLCNNNISINYDGIKQFENDNLYIENYDRQLNLLGYHTITDYNDFNEKFELLINFNVNKLKNVPSILLKNRKHKKNKINDDYVDKLKIIWDKNVCNIFNSLIKAIKMSDKEKENIIQNNYENIIKNYNKNKYYENINNILNLNLDLDI